MSQGSDPHDELPEAQFGALRDLLGSAAVWGSPHPGVEENVIASVYEEASLRPRMPSAPGREDRRHLWIIAFAAAFLLIAGVSIGLLATRNDTGDIVSLQGTELAPGASASAELEPTPQGLRVLMSIIGLAPAEQGKYYQGWVRNDTDGVTIGTFHLRGGDGEVELWAGVLADEYPIVTVTLQQEGAGPESSGQVVLRGRLDE